jgi:GST-like protein
MKKLLLVGSAGCGSVIVEFAFNLAGIAYDYEEVDYSDDSPTRARLLEVNPLGQVPALVLPDGQLMTESLAMLHWIQDQAPQAMLIPPRGDASRATFYRWAVFLIAAVYPTFTYGDDAKKWVAGDAKAGELLRASTNEHRQRLLKQMEGACGAPHFLGERFSAIDLYLAAMCHWRPGRKWWQVEVPKLMAAAQAAITRPEVGRVVQRDFK